MVGVVGFVEAPGGGCGGEVVEGASCGGVDGGLGVVEGGGVGLCAGGGDVVVEAGEDDGVAGGAGGEVDVSGGGGSGCGEFLGDPVFGAGAWMVGGELDGGLGGVLHWWSFRFCLLRNYTSC